MRQSERRRLKPAEDLISDLNSDADFNSKSAPTNKTSTNKRTRMQIDLNKSNNHRQQESIDEYDIKTPDLDNEFRFQVTHYSYLLLLCCVYAHSDTHFG